LRLKHLEDLKLSLILVLNVNFEEISKIRLNRGFEILNILLKLSPKNGIKTSLKKIQSFWKILYKVEPYPKI